MKVESICSIKFKNPNTCITPTTTTPPSVIHSDMVYDPEYTTDRTSNLVDCNFIHI